MNKENRSLNLETKNQIKIVIDPERMTAASENLQKTSESVVMATGYPEEAGEYTDKDKLDVLIEKVVDRGNGFIQVYMGKTYAGIKNNSKNLNNALNLEREKDDVKLVLFSAGARAIAAKKFEIPKNIKQIMFMSPLIGKEVIRHQKGMKGLMNIALIRLFRIPTVEQYFQSIKQLIQSAKNNDIKITLLTTLEDSFLNQEKIIEEFKKRFPQADFLEAEGDHAPELSKIEKILYPAEKNN